MWNERHVQILNAVKTSQVGLGLLVGCAKVFKEKVGGAKTDRIELAKLLRRIEPGDVLIVTRLDRPVRDLLNVIAALADRVRHARGRSPESQEAGGRLRRMIF